MKGIKRQQLFLPLFLLSAVFFLVRQFATSLNDDYVNISTIHQVDDDMSNTSVNGTIKSRHEKVKQPAAVSDGGASDTKFVVPSNAGASRELGDKDTAVNAKQASRTAPQENDNGEGGPATQHKPRGKRGGGKNKNNKRNNKPDPNLRFLQHFSGSGWSNQVHSYMSAYYLAKATGRVLVTSPVLPNRRIFGDHNRLEGNKEEFDTGYNIRKAYMRVVRPHEYISLQRIVDMDYTFPNVTTMDYKEFSSSPYWSKDMTNFVLEKNYSRLNTVFTLNRPDLEGTLVDDDNVNVTYKDIRTIAEQAKDYKIWTFLDSFQHLHPSMMTGTTQEPMRLRYNQEIRNMARTIQREVWNNMSYAALHIRGGDGPWGFRKVIWDTTRQVMVHSISTIQEWLQKQQQNQQSATSSMNKIALFVATDMPKFLLPQVQDFIDNKLKEELPPKVSVQVLFSSSFENYTQQLKEAVMYPDIFLDQQLAACAPIGFSPSPGAGHISVSTFSELIMTIRNSPGAC